MKQTLFHKGKVWSYSSTFLHSDSRLSEEQREYLVEQTLISKLDNARKKDFVNEALNLEGKINLVKKNAFMGTFFGPQYELDFDSDHGKSTVGFIIADISPAVYN